MSNHHPGLVLVGWRRLYRERLTELLELLKTTSEILEPDSNNDPDPSEDGERLIAN